MDMCGRIRIRDTAIGLCLDGRIQRFQALSRDDGGELLASAACTRVATITDRLASFDYRALANFAHEDAVRIKVSRWSTSLRLPGCQESGRTTCLVGKLARWIERANQGRRR